MVLFFRCSRPNYMPTPYFVQDIFIIPLYCIPYLDIFITPYTFHGMSYLFVLL
jgi:hypothetical protein